MFFYLITYFFLSRSLLSHHIPKRQKTTNPKSKLQNPDQKARLPWGKRKSFVPKGLPLILMEKIGLFAPCFFSCFFPVIKAALFFLFRQCIFCSFFFGYFDSIFVIWLISFIICLFCMFFLYLFIFSVLSIAFPLHPKTQTKNKSKIQTPKSRSKSAKLRPERHKHLNPLLPLILIKKLGCLPHVFFIFFSCHQSCVVFSVRFIGFTITSQNA